MDLHRLWTPWRMSYINDDRAGDCPFCAALIGAEAHDSLVVYTGEKAYVVMNLFPYNTGHLLVVPNAHVSSIEELDSQTRAEIFELANQSMEQSRRALGADGFNLGMNIGPVSGAGIADHAHLHIVPRWFGDTNFMPLIANTKVLPELLQATRARIKAEFVLSASDANDALRPAAGAVVIDRTSRSVVLRRTTQGELVLPKGKVEPGETAAAAAIREFDEETGYVIELAGWAGSEITDLSPNPRLHTVYFLAYGRPGPTTAAHLESDTVLVPASDVANKLTFARQREIVTTVVGGMK